MTAEMVRDGGFESEGAERALYQRKEERGSMMTECEAVRDPQWRKNGRRD